MRWLRTKDGEWVNGGHVERVRRGKNGYYAIFPDGRTIDLCEDAPDMMAEKIVPALPGYAVFFWDENGLFETGEQVIMWLVDPFLPGFGPTPVGDFCGSMRDVGQGYAIRRPDGSWIIPDDAEYKDRAAVEAEVARRAKPKLTA